MIVKYLKQLPKEYKEKALKYHSKYNKHTKVYPNSIGDALILAFKWSNTEEGRKYWEHVYNLIKNGPIPERTYISVYIKKKVIIPKRNINSIYIKVSDLNTKYKKYKMDSHTFSRIGITYYNLDDALQDVVTNTKIKFK